METTAAGISTNTSAGASAIAKQHYEHVLRKPWAAPGLVKPPKVQRLPASDAGAAKSLTRSAKAGKTLLDLTTVSKSSFIIRLLQYWGSLEENVVKKNWFPYAILAIGFAALVVAPVIAGSLGGPLELADEGTFFVGGRSIFSENPGDPGSRVGGAGAGHIMIEQMYVHYRIPKVVSAPPIVMVHGSTHTGATFETTPDGREGWATYFARKGYPVYVVDHVGRGRSGFDPTPINRAIVQSDVKLLSQIAIPTRERAWQSFHFGPEYPLAYPGTQFPVEATEQYLAQLVPNTEVTLAGQGIKETPKALVALLDKIGPAILMVHSQAGGYGLEVVRQSDKVRALVDIEGSCGPLSADDVSKRFVKQPMLSFWGDNTVGALGPNGDTRRNGCISTVNTIRAAGGNAKFFLLPDNGIKGNTHMMMFDKNNLQVADIIMKWLGEVGDRK